MKGKLLTKEELITNMEAALEHLKNNTSPVGTISWNIQAGEGPFFDVVMFTQTINSLGMKEGFLIGELD